MKDDVQRNVRITSLIIMYLGLPVFIVIMFVIIGASITATRLDLLPRSLMLGLPIPALYIIGLFMILKKKIKNPVTELSLSIFMLILLWPMLVSLWLFAYL